MAKSFSYIAGVAVFVSAIVTYYVWTGGGSDAFTPTARDNQRMKDMHALSDALAAYYEDNSVYPVAPPSVDCNPPYNNVAGLADALAPKYIKSIGKDPNPPSCGYNYWYWSDTHNYALLAHLETLNGNDYPDRWCIGAFVGTYPVDYIHMKPCP